MLKNSISMKKNRGRKQTATVIALVLLLVASAIIISIPTVNAARNITLRWMTSHRLIGVNQPLVMGIVVSLSNFASVYGVDWGQLKATKTYVWSDAYVIFTRPDGTTDILEGPFELGIAQRPRFEYAPDMVGTWKALFVFPGDENYNPATVACTFDVQQQAIPKRNTWAYLNLHPADVIGLGQSLMVNAWVSPPPIMGSEVYEDYLFTITGPDGTSFTVGPMWSEGSGTVWFDLPMTELGNWTFKFDFPGNSYSNPSTISRTIMVQTDSVTIGYPDTPLPTEEWQFPISVQNREWRTIAGPWYQPYYNSSKGAWNPYTEAPKTAHVLWKLEADSGMGGYVGSPSGIQTGSGDDVYGATDEGIYSNSGISVSVIMAGRGYYNAGGKIHCIDMRTGDLLWEVPGSFHVGATRARRPVLYQFGSTFNVYDALTGEKTLSVPGMSMAANLFDDPYVYSMQDVWSRYMDQEIGKEPGDEQMVPEGRLIKWDTGGTSENFTERIVWNVSLAHSFDPANNGFTVLHNGLIVHRNWWSQSTVTHQLRAWNATTGEMVYDRQLHDLEDPETWVYSQGPMVGSGYGLFYFAGEPPANQAHGWYAFDIATGALKWISEKTDYPWGGFWAYMAEPCAYGMIYGLSYQGVYAFNATDGKIVWHYMAEDPYNELPYDHYVFGSVGGIVGGGVLFAPATEHSPTFYYRGQELHALNAFTGEKLWSIKGEYSPSAIAYGILVAADRPNGFTYAFGKGSTETTVSVSAATVGSGILIQGTVSDQSAAQKGTPAIADDNMTAWMEYLHMQQPMPTDIKGVQVHLTAVDPNGNVQEIGTTTSTAKGNYKILWNPPIEGAYTVTAEFEGSEAYYGSSAEASFGVGPASAAPSIEPSSTPTTPSITTPAQTTPATSTSPSASPNTAVQPPTSGMSIETYMVIAAAVVLIVIAAAAIVLRRRHK